MLLFLYLLLLFVYLPSSIFNYLHISIFFIQAFLDLSSFNKLFSVVFADQALPIFFIFLPHMCQFKVPIDVFLRIISIFRSEDLSFLVKFHLVYVFHELAHPLLILHQAIEERLQVLLVLLPLGRTLQPHLCACLAFTLAFLVVHLVQHTDLHVAVMDLRLLFFVIRVCWGRICWLLVVFFIRFLRGFVGSRFFNYIKRWDGLYIEVYCWILMYLIWTGN